MATDAGLMESRQIGNRSRGLRRAQSAKVSEHRATRSSLVVYWRGVLGITAKVLSLSKDYWVLLLSGFAVVLQFNTVLGVLRACD